MSFLSTPQPKIYSLSCLPARPSRPLRLGGEPALAWPSPLMPRLSLGRCLTLAQAQKPAPDQAENFPWPGREFSLAKPKTHRLANWPTGQLPDTNRAPGSPGSIQDIASCSAACSSAGSLYGEGHQRWQARHGGAGLWDGRHVLQQVGNKSISSVSDVSVKSSI